VSTEKQLVSFLVSDEPRESVQVSSFGICHAVGIRFKVFSSSEIIVKDEGIFSKADGQAYLISPWKMQKKFQ
jgi:hypothetical protein